MAKMKDPVCGMHVDVEDTTWKTEYEGRLFVFCSPGCKAAFEKEPERYIHQDEKRES